MRLRTFGKSPKWGMTSTSEGEGSWFRWSKYVVHTWLSREDILTHALCMPNWWKSVPHWINQLSEVIVVVLSIELMRINLWGRVTTDLWVVRVRVAEGISQWPIWKLTNYMAWREMSSSLWNSLWICKRQNRKKCFCSTIYSNTRNVRRSNDSVLRSEQRTMNEN